MRNEKGCEWWMKRPNERFFVWKGNASVAHAVAFNGLFLNSKMKKRMESPISPIECSNVNHTKNFHSSKWFIHRIQWKYFTGNSLRGLISTVAQRKREKEIENEMDRNCKCVETIEKSINTKFCETEKSIKCDTLIAMQLIYNDSNSITVCAIQRNQRKKKLTSEFSKHKYFRINGRPIEKSTIMIIIIWLHAYFAYHLFGMVNNNVWIALAIVQYGSVWIIQLIKCYESENRLHFTA